MIFLKSAQHYKRYVYMVQFENACSVYRYFKEIPHIVGRSLGCGHWNVLLICENTMNFSLVQGVQQCVFQGVKGLTYLSKVTSLDWDKSLERMYTAVSRPTKKSFLYEEIPSILWKDWEWNLFYRLQQNVRVEIMPILKELKITFEKYQKWMASLEQYAVIQCGFYPFGIDNYFAFDFLFESVYHKDLVHILGMLPSTSVFYTVGDTLFARLFVLDKREKDDLFTLILTLREKKYFTDCYQANVILTGGLV